MPIPNEKIDDLSSEIPQLSFTKSEYKALKFLYENRDEGAFTLDEITEKVEIPNLSHANLASATTYKLIERVFGNRYRTVDEELVKEYLDFYEENTIEDN